MMPKRIRSWNGGKLLNNKKMGARRRIQEKVTTK